jgi:hypothetical protein
MNIWTNGSWTIHWINEDEIEINGPYNQHCIMCGGDFESMLSALCAAWGDGKNFAKKSGI